MGLGEKKLKVLVVDDDPGLRYSVSTTLRNSSRFNVEEAIDGQMAVDKVKEIGFDLVILDVDMPRKNGLQALREIKEHDPSTIVLILTAYANVDDAIQAVKEGAYNYIPKPVRGEQLVELVDRALEAYALVSRVAASSPVLVEKGRRFIGNTAEMKKVFELVLRLSKVDTAVLIRGESGTGKELVARAIHFNSSRKENKFVALNCSAIPETLFESELFGHEKGAFTGADQRKIGKFQYAEGGTVFLDEIGDMPLLMQAKLLRVLQEKKFSPVGANRELESNVRIVAATNRNLDEMIKRGEFREDLFYRLNVIPIFLPPLRERLEDIENMVNSFINKFNNEHGKKVIGIAPEAMACLKKYDWPGNIRELENVVEYAFVLEETNRLTISSLPEKILRAAGVQTVERNSSSSNIDVNAEPSNRGDITGATSVAQIVDSFDPNNLDFNRQKEMFEKEFIIKALKTFKGRINQTALHANIPKKTLLRKIEKYGINPREYCEPK